MKVCVTNTGEIAGKEVVVKIGAESAEMEIAVNRPDGTKNTPVRKTRGDILRF